MGYCQLSAVRISPFSDTLSTPGEALKLSWILGVVLSWDAGGGVTSHKAVLKAGR